MASLAAWASVEATTVLYARASASTVHLVKDGDLDGFHSGARRVRTWEDLSGRGNHLRVPAGERMPTFAPTALDSAHGPHAALDFSSRTSLATAPFRVPLPQPVTLMLVARAHGDVTLADALTERSSRFELCHGYPTWH